MQVFSELAAILDPETDSAFAASMTQALNLLLLTAPELADLRARLQNALHDAASAKLLQTLYSCWCHSACASLSLCMLAQAYTHVDAMIHALAELPLLPVLLAQVDRCALPLALGCMVRMWLRVTGHLHCWSCTPNLLHAFVMTRTVKSLRKAEHEVLSLMLHVTCTKTRQGCERCCGLLSSSHDKSSSVDMPDACRFVMLVDSPVFTRVRLQLLCPGQFPDLMRSMYSLLMLCPQSNSFHTLQVCTSCSII